MEDFALDGVRVADFTWAWAGPYATMLLADMGAEIINIETYPRASNLRLNPPYPKGQPGGVNRSGWWSASQRGKLSCTLDLKKPKGLELAKSIVSISDVVTENFSPEVMERLGLSYPVLKEIKPDIIYIALSGYGAIGPQSNRISYGGHVVMSAGLTAITGFPDAPPAQIMIPYGDPIGGLSGAFAVLAALHYRSRTGEGQYIDLSQTEAMACFVPEALMDYAMNQNVRTRCGNRDDFMAPHGCYPCQGEENWVTIAVSTEEEWRTLCRVMGNPDWTREERFSTELSRWQNQDELDKLIGAWTRKHTHYEVMKMLQEAGVAAAPSLNGAELPDDPHLKERGFLAEDGVPEMGRKKIAGPSWKMSGTPGKIRWPAPSLGKHNEYVFGDLLGLSRDEIAALSEEEVILRPQPT